MKRLIVLVAAACAALFAAASGAVAAPARPVAAPPAASADDATVVPIQVTGAPADRWNLVILGDGYTAAEMPKFLAAANRQLSVLLTFDPWKSYRNYFNVYAVETPSPVSGISCDPLLNYAKRTTPLSMTLGGCGNGNLPRLLTMSNQAATTYANLAPKDDQILALGNSDTYGGAGGTYATATGGNALSQLIAPHELGHSFGNLQDEYDYYNRGVPGGTYTGSDPNSAHLTTLTIQQMVDRQTKWYRWLGVRSNSGGTIGEFEGGDYAQYGIYRPSQHSMMRSLGYEMDQVEVEQMTARLSGKVDLIRDATPTGAPVAANDDLWLDPAHPVNHALRVTWSVNGKVLRNTGNASTINLAAVHAKRGATVSARVVDNTPLVRDPALRTQYLTATRTWTVGAANTVTAPTVEPHIALATPNTVPVGATDVIWVDPSHPVDHADAVAWTLDGHVVGRGTSLDLASVKPPSGASTLKVRVTDPDRRHAEAAEEKWTVDNGMPSTKYTVAGGSGPVIESTNRDRTPHYTVRGSFTLALAATDAQPGTVISQMRVDGDGWYQYFGSPTDSSAPYPFSPTGTNVDDLVYGNLGTGGLAVSPFDPDQPGYGTHQIEYRSIDAAGNVARAKRFTVTVRPDTDPTPGAVPLTTSAITSCPTDQTRIRVTARNASKTSATITVHTVAGDRTFTDVAPRAGVTATFRTGEPTTETGSARVTATGRVGAKTVSASYDVPYNRYACT